MPAVKRRVSGGECHYRYVKKTLFSLLTDSRQDPASPRGSQLQRRGLACQTRFTPQGSPGYGTHFDLRKPRMDTVFQARRLAL